MIKDVQAKRTDVQKKFQAEIKALYSRLSKL
jgi:hypothetical protein